MDADNMRRGVIREFLGPGLIFAMTSAVRQIEVGGGDVLTWLYRKSPYLNGSIYDDIYS